MSTPPPPPPPPPPPLDVVAPAEYSAMFPLGPSSSSPGHRSTPISAMRRIPMWPFRLVAIGGVAIAFVLYGWQVFRVIDEQPRLAVLAWTPFLAGAIGAVGIVMWTYFVAENARRIFSPATTQEPPRPGATASTWIVPIVFAAAAAATVSALSDRLNSPVDGSESSLPLVMAIVAILLMFPVTYSPVMALTSVVRKVGGRGIKLAEWLWVPVVLAAVGAAMIAALRAGGTFGDDDTLAPTWVVGVAAIIPATVVVLLGWRSAIAVEDDIVRAFERRSGENRSLTRRRGRFSALYADDGPNYQALSEVGRIRQIPFVGPLGIVVTAGLAGLALLNIVGAIVMYLFWGEAADGVLLQTQSDRAWDLLATLHSAERDVAFVVLVAAAIWTLLAVTNVRLASARRRNPLLAALAWPAAGVGIWIVANRMVNEGSANQVIIGFLAQGAILVAPFMLLERSAVSIGARRNPFRAAAAVGLILLVHTQGLGGLSTYTPSTDSTEIARLTGYLAVGALLQLVATFVVTDATRSLNEVSTHVADTHNRLIEQRTSPGTAAAPSRRIGQPA